MRVTPNGNRRGFFQFSPILVTFLAFAQFRYVCCILSLNAEVICARVSGLTAKQREMCRTDPDAMVAIGDGVRLARQECRYQFRHQRWNCTAIGNPESFGHVVVVGSREAAFTYAIHSAGVTYAITAACARGNISTCGCATGPRPREPTPAGWKWSGCSVDVAFGMRFARKFLDARELEGDERSLMNLHNNKAGRKAIKLNLITECKCHGVSGSCTMKTCWKSLPPFRHIGDNLMKKYYRARSVATMTAQPQLTLHKRLAPIRPQDLLTTTGKIHLVLKKGRIPTKKRPKQTDLVFLQSSPNYCEKDLASGSLGTYGRNCNRTSQGHDGCNLMCCGRGYNTHQFNRQWQCNCKFHWCCQVQCDTCSERVEEYTCK
ncbi:LOW QUALITY PROTEIN: protein Wnt-7b-like [Atheta coriaria]|uniref:LOW QUALITY PROTEIN: protein Wnt-7b-like n=1 Tax=Dalotia coriaria TaxID=877792 RepID=UPI0031F33A59